jgi:hypothetical protein
MTNYNIQYTKFGIANRFPDYRIEINQGLKEPKYAPLLKEILAHEKRHTDLGVKWGDVQLDMEGFKNRGLYWNFILTHPSSWMQFLPLYPSEKKTYFDLTVLILWVILIVVIFGFMWLIKFVEAAI